MIFVDSSVWIDYLRGAPTAQAERLDVLMGSESLATGDLVMAEVLQGIADEEKFLTTLEMFDTLMIVELGGRTNAIAGARNFQRLRAKGITIRKTIDTLIATRCIADGHALLYADRDFDPFVAHLGLVSALALH